MAHKTFLQVFEAALLAGCRTKDIFWAIEHHELRAFKRVIKKDGEWVLGDWQIWDGDLFAYCEARHIKMKPAAGE
jgi:hypothetical protein